jgi:hypothetical protein
MDPHEEVAVALASASGVDEFTARGWCVSLHLSDADASAVLRLLRAAAAAWDPAVPGRLPVSHCQWHANVNTLSQSFIAGAATLDSLLSATVFADKGYLVGTRLPSRRMLAAALCQAGCLLSSTVTRHAAGMGDPRASTVLAVTGLPSRYAALATSC